MIRRCVLIAFSAVVPVPKAAAQLDTAIASTLRHARRIRVEYTDRQRIEGIFQEMAPSYLRFRAIIRPTLERAFFEDREVRLDSLSRIWVQNGSHWHFGAAMGAATFGLMGAGLAIIFAGGGDSPGCSVGRGACVVGATVGGAAVGAVFGGLVGALFMRWRAVWPP